MAKAPILARAQAPTTTPPTPVVGLVPPEVYSHSTRMRIQHKPCANCKKTVAMFYETRGTFWAHPHNMDVMCNPNAGPDSTIAVVS